MRTTARKSAGIYAGSNKYVGITAVALNQRGSLNERLVDAGRMAISNAGLKQRRGLVREVCSSATPLDCEFFLCRLERNSNEVALGVF
jgi:tagatose-1,6-bisphosphate aldolase